MYTYIYIYIYPKVDGRGHVSWPCWTLRSCSARPPVTRVVTAHEFGFRAPRRKLAKVDMFRRCCSFGVDLNNLFSQGLLLYLESVLLLSSLLLLLLSVVVVGVVLALLLVLSLSLLVFVLLLSLLFCRSDTASRCPQHERREPPRNPSSHLLLFVIAIIIITLHYITLY